MTIIKAYAYPHPPLAVPAVGRGEEEKIAITLAAFEETAAEIARLAPETIIFITPHNTLYADYFIISPGEKAKGSLSRFGAPDVKFKVSYDKELAEEIGRLARGNGIPAGPRGEKEASLDHGVMVPMWYIDRFYQDYEVIRISLSGREPAEHYRLGQSIASAAEKTGRRTVLVASGDLSHKLPGSTYGFAPEGRDFDRIITDAFSSGDFMPLFSISEDLRERAGECGYNSFMILAGCFDRRKVESKLYSYEGPFGIGYAVAGFSPGEPDHSCNYLDRHRSLILEKARESQALEDPYRSLARQSLEHMVNFGNILALPEDLPEELTKDRAGVFVSLHKGGRLRGCIGTIAPTKDNIALEIIDNAVSAGIYDNRFDQVNAKELPYLTYKVDILSPPEPISGPEELDVKRYGVIVSSGNKRGLLLPNLEGIDTVKEQIAIARKKAGISADAPVMLERFEVIRHE
ncbi:MAG: AmmeMemoRadiSam system protein A [Clostridiales bacterium]|jgi:AmmeMemoRadiSam system protein A|nr:AmmeMemoRadiSam system protein A [Clostridiales bacterium]